MRALYQDLLTQLENPESVRVGEQLMTEATAAPTPLAPSLVKSRP